MSYEYTFEAKDRISVLTVTQLNEYIRMMLEGNPVLSHVYVKGEISNVTHHRSGHLYFSIKDEEGLIRAVMFRSSAMLLPFRAEEGMKVLVHGRVTLYGKSGQYQINVDSMQPEGIGSLYIAYEQMKKRLEAEGLFDPSRKKTLPRFPERIGIITSPTGAAVRDMMQIAARRFPFTELILYPALVQGQGAAADLTAGIRYFDRATQMHSSDAVDLVIIGRGGGSLEDLWAFNDEGLARAIAQASVPIISAVGHETDFTICDFVADLRAPTPSAAVELALPEQSEIKEILSGTEAALITALRNDLKRKRLELSLLARSSGLSKPSYAIDEKRMHLDHLAERLYAASTAVMEQKRMQVLGNATRLEDLNPLRILSRGYTAVTTDDLRICTSAAMLSPGDLVKIRFSDGTKSAEILPDVPCIEKC